MKVGVKGVVGISPSIIDMAIPYWVESESGQVHARLWSECDSIGIGGKEKCGDYDETMMFANNALML